MQIRVWVAAVVAGVALLVVPMGVLAQQTQATAGQGSPDKAAAPRELLVVVSIPPVQGIVKPLLDGSGMAYRLETLVPVGASEHGYEIPPSKLAELRRADVVVIVGLGLEPQIEKFLKQNERPARRVLVLADAAGVTHDHAHEDEHDDHAGHAHGPDGECLHSVDPHIWLDPVLVEKAVSAVAQTLRDASAGGGGRGGGRDGNGVGTAAQNAEIGTKIWLAEEAMLKRVKGVHEAYEAGLKPASRRTIVVGHDAWGYLARRYALETVAIKGLLASEPTPKSLTDATRAVRDKGVTTIFVEPQLSQKAGQTLAAATGATVRVLDPLGTGDWFAMMDANLIELKQALGVNGPAAQPTPPGTTSPGTQGGPAGGKPGE